MNTNIKMTLSVVYIHDNSQNNTLIESIVHVFNSLQIGFPINLYFNEFLDMFCNVYPIGVVWKIQMKTIKTNVQTILHG